MIWYIAMSDYDDGVGGLIFFAVLTPIAGLVMYLNSLCLRPGFDQIHANLQFGTYNLYGRFVIKICVS